MKAILIIAGVILALGLFSMFAPAIIGIAVGVLFISWDLPVIGVITIVIGIIANVGFWEELFDGSVHTPAGSSTDQTDLYEEDEIYEEQKRAEDEDAAAFIGLLSHLDHKDD